MNKIKKYIKEKIPLIKDILIASCIITLVLLCAIIPFIGKRMLLEMKKYVNIKLKEDSKINPKTQNETDDPPNTEFL